MILVISIKSGLRDLIWCNLVGLLWGQHRDRKVNSPKERRRQLKRKQWPESGWQFAFISHYWANDTFFVFFFCSDKKKIRPFLEATRDQGTTRMSGVAGKCFGRIEGSNHRIILWRYSIRLLGIKHYANHRRSVESAWKEGKRHHQARVDFCAHYTGDEGWKAAGSIC